MNDAYQEAIKEAYASAPAGVIVYETLEIRQEGVQDPLFVVKSRQELIAFDENGVLRTFEPVHFDLSLPPSNEEGFRSLNIAVDNVNRRASDFVDIAKSEVEPVKVLYRPYVSTDLTRPQMIPPLVLFLKDIKINEYQVAGRCTFMDIVNKKFPSQLYTRELFPALG